MANRSSVEVRRFAMQDVDELLRLMRALAAFEGYIDALRVTRESLIEHGLGPSPRFRAYVAALGDGRLAGMAVTYPVLWTYTMRPRLVLKELYIDQAFRGAGIGMRLMHEVVQEASALGADRIDWTVLATNDRAKDFYTRLGGSHDTLWENWTLPIVDQA